MVYTGLSINMDRLSFARLMLVAADSSKDSKGRFKSSTGVPDSSWLMFTLVAWWGRRYLISGFVRHPNTCIAIILVLFIDYFIMLSTKTFCKIIDKTLSLVTTIHLYHDVFRQTQIILGPCFKKLTSICLSVSCIFYFGINSTDRKNNTSLLDDNSGKLILNSFLMNYSKLLFFYF